MKQSMNKRSQESWQRQEEKGSPFFLKLTVWMALNLGRRVTGLILWPIAIFYFVFSASTRRYCHFYLQRNFQRKVSSLEVLKHIYSFAVVSVDRIYFLANKANYFSVEMTGTEIFDQLQSQDQGAILIVSHFGSFEVMRSLAEVHQLAPIRIVLDKQQNTVFINLLASLAPAMASAIIDAGQSPPALALAVKDALDNGHYVGIMADRCRGELGSEYSFLGTNTRFPTSPWQLAHVLKAQTILCYGVFRGGSNYALSFEALPLANTVKRSQRRAVIEQQLQNYVSSLENKVKEAPYNWFNFYDFWQDDSANDN